MNKNILEGIAPSKIPSYLLKLAEQDREFYILLLEEYCEKIEKEIRELEETIMEMCHD